jgi:DNA-binding XRE family transcriptional regulator
MGTIIKFPRRRHHGRASAATGSEGSAIPQRAGSARSPRALNASDIIRNISGGIEPRLRQLDTACAPRLTMRATSNVPPRASITASTEFSGASGIMVEPDIYTERVFCKPIHLVCSSDLGISAPFPAMPKHLLHPRSVEAVRLRLIALRMAIGPNQRRFAEKAAIANNTWSNYENEVGRRISLEEAFKLVDTYGVTLDWIYEGRAGQMPGDLMEKIRAVEAKAAAKVAA